MRVVTWFLLVAFAAHRTAAQSLISPDSITVEWAQHHLIGGIDAPAPGFGKTFACVKSWPEVPRALIAIYNDSHSGTLSRADAILVLGGTGQDTAFRFLISTLDHTAPNDPLRQDMILALGNSADPPEYVYEWLKLALLSDTGDDLGMAARALSDIRSARAEEIVRAARAADVSTSKAAFLDRTLARFHSGHGRITTPCDSTMLRRG
jgi:hypothetical protein